MYGFSEALHVILTEDCRGNPEISEQDWVKSQNLNISTNKNYFILLLKSGPPILTIR